MGNDILDAVALWGGIFGVGSDIQVEPSPVLQKYV
jgi:hypothetical protein